jgi:superfamily II RNA helicase
MVEHEAANRIEALFDSICDTFEITPDEQLEELRSLVRHGIAFHHAGMLPLHKELVERLFTSGLLQLLFATETFSLGINMPAHTVVFASLRKFDGVGFSTLKVREYQQMAGRAGRQGLDARGLVISILEDDRVTPRDIQRLTGNDVEPILSRFNLSYSTLINLHRTLGPRLYEAWERSFNNFQWARMSKKKREKNEEKQRHAIALRLQLLHSLGYITEEGVTEKGKIAAVINGYELPIAELVESRVLEYLDEMQLCIVLAGLVHEERKNELHRRLPPAALGESRRDIEQVVGRLVEKEHALGLPASIRPIDFRLGSAVAAWCHGAGFEELREHTTAPPGDLVRVMRLTVQLLRQLRAALPRTSPLVPLLDRARDLLNRDEVDAARQLSLG